MDVLFATLLLESVRPVILDSDGMLLTLPAPPALTIPSVWVSTTIPVCPVQPITVTHAQSQLVSALPALLESASMLLLKPAPTASILITPWVAPMPVDYASLMLANPVIS